MTRNYSTKTFFRQTSNTLLARFFHKHELFADLDFSSMKEAKPEELFNQWLDLPVSDRNALDAIFQEIYELACEKGSLAIVDETKWQMQGEPEKLAIFIEMFSSLKNHYDRAMIAYLDYHECWRGATYFYHADSLTHWRKRVNMGHNLAAVDQKSCLQFAEQILHYFHTTQARGNHCIVEPYRRNELDYYFAYPEDYSQHSAEWDNDEFARRPHNPAFEVVFIYSQSLGTLSINCKGSKEVVESLQNIFAKVILNLPDLPLNPEDNRIYDLNILLRKNFRFVQPIDSGIVDVKIKTIRLSSRVTNERITFEPDTTEDPFAVYDIIERAEKSFPIHLYNVSRVEIVASIVVDINKPPKNISFHITYPNYCSLKYDDIGLKLRKMLANSGIEPTDTAATSIETEETIEA